MRALWDLYRLYDGSVRGDLQRLAQSLRERLSALGARGLGREEVERRIVLPWRWQQLPEVPGEPRGTARQRLLRMGFGGAEPAGRKGLGADTRLLLGAFVGIALAGLVGVGQRIAYLGEVAVSYDAAVYASPLFQGLVTVRERAGRLHAASRKLAAVRELLPGEGHLRVHWCWSGLSADQAAAPCRGLLENREDPRRVNILPMGDSALLRAGSLAEPIRACAPDWPDLSVAVIAADPWTWPEQADNNRAARQLAIRLLDSGAVDLALIGPAESNAADEVARQWSFVEDSQWLFFSRLPEKAPDIAVPALGAHRALIRADYAELAVQLRDRVDGLFDPHDPKEPSSADVVRVESLTGNPRLWGGPEVIQGPAGIAFVRVCPGTFTMGSHPSPAEMGEDDPAWPYSNEHPAHPVLLDAFEIARTEITWDQLRALRPAALDNRRNEHDAVPATDIDWRDARTACRSVEDSTDPDLPTEAQWEYAARAGTQTPWSWGSDAGQAGDYAWYGGNDDGSAKPVGEKRPNPIGLYDMHGNAWEWVRDCYDDNAYAGRGPQPTAEPPEDGVGCGRRVLRGGSFYREPRHLRSAVRFRYEPESRYGSFGFRCVRGSVRQLVD